MATARPVARVHTVRGDGSLSSGLLRGCRFRVCENRLDAERALEVRRRVYNDGCGYDVPIPDQYDARSWLLMAEDAVTGEAVGSMRVTPRWRGRLEAEEYFTLPQELLVPRLLEVTRFAVLPVEKSRATPAVALGLLKVSARFMQLVGGTRVVICSRMDRVHFYTWLGFQPTGLVAPYGKLSNLDHALLTADSLCEQRAWKLFVDSPHGEIVLPARIPPLGFGRPFPARAVRRQPYTRNERTPGAPGSEPRFLVAPRKTP